MLSQELSVWRFSIAFRGKSAGKGHLHLLFHACFSPVFSFPAVVSSQLEIPVLQASPFSVMVLHEVSDSVHCVLTTSDWPFLSSTVPVTVFCISLLHRLLTGLFATWLPASNLLSAIQPKGFLNANLVLLKTDLL